jgi:hypothetical protein
VIIATPKGRSARPPHAPDPSPEATLRPVQSSHGSEEPHENRQRTSRLPRKHSATSQRPTKPRRVYQDTSRTHRYFLSKNSSPNVSLTVGLRRAFRRTFRPTQNSRKLSSMYPSCVMNPKTHSAKLLRGLELSYEPNYGDGAFASSPHPNSPRVSSTHINSASGSRRTLRQSSAGI